VPAIAEASKGGATYIGKSAPVSREEASAPRKRKSAGRRKKAEESRGERSSVPHTGKDAARL